MANPTRSLATIKAASVDSMLQPTGDQESDDEVEATEDAEANVQSSSETDAPNDPDPESAESEGKMKGESGKNDSHAAEGDTTEVGNG